MTTTRLMSALLCAFLACATAPAGAAEVNVYTYREQALLRPVLDLFTRQTGIKVNVIYSARALEERIRAEGTVSPADVILALDIAVLAKARDMGLLQPIKSRSVDEAVPARFRDPGDAWVALSWRPRVIYAARDRVRADTLTYDDLALPQWKGKVCARSGLYPDNAALLAGMVQREGEARASAWIAGLKANLARKPAGTDRAQVKDIASGICDLALGSTYDYARMASGEAGPEQKQQAGAIRVILPTYAGGGTHAAMSGVGLVKTAPNKAQATKLIDFMVSDEAQRIYAATSVEYPVRPGTPLAPLLETLGDVTPDRAEFNDLARQRARADALIDTAGFDDGPAG